MSQETLILEHLRSGQKLSPMEEINHMKENWKPIINYEGLYSVSDKGKIRRDTGKGRILKNNLSKDGYPTICLCKNGIQETRHIAHLVLESFVGKRPKGYEVNHKNCIKTDNYLLNLEYVTKLENIRHAWRNGRRDHCCGENHGTAKTTLKKVRIIRNLYKTKKYSYRKLANKLNISKFIIFEILSGRTWKRFI